MNISGAQLLRQRHALSDAARQAIRRAVRSAPHVDVELAEAVASRETNMRNITGDGGHGRGMWQQDDRFQEQFLRAVQGCKPDTSVPVFKVADGGAFPKGRVPTISAGARRMVSILETNVGEAVRLGVPEGHRTAFAVAAYNAGVGGAWRGWQESRNPDKYTAGGDYSDDVLERARYLRSHQ